jgi:extradiol dioxygenase family protein
VVDAFVAPFHHAFPVRSMEETRHFYGTVLGCATARRDSDRAVDFNFFGHHIVAHLVEGADAEVHHRAAGGRNVAVRHSGVVLPWPHWEALAARLHGHGVAFMVEPEIRHHGEPQEEALMLLCDASDNVLEFKTFKDIQYLFADPLRGDAA